MPAPPAQGECRLRTRRQEHTYISSHHPVFSAESANVTNRVSPSLRRMVWCTENSFPPTPRLPWNMYFYDLYTSPLPQSSSACQIVFLLLYVCVDTGWYYWENVCACLVVIKMAAIRITLRGHDWIGLLTKFPDHLAFGKSHCPFVFWLQVTLSSQNYSFGTANCMG